MTTRFPATLMLFVVAASFGTAQDILHYKFESGGGNTDINFGQDTAGIPRLAPIVAASGLSPSQAWGPGLFGSGLSAGPVNQFSGFELDTGWDDVVGPAQDLTLAFFFRLVHPMPSNEVASFCGPPTSGAGIRVLVSSSPTAFGRVTFSWASDNLNGAQATLVQDLLTPSFANWVHLAIVVDRSGSPGCQSGVVQFFVNGVPQFPIAPSACFHNIEGTSLNTFRVGKKSDANFRYDDFRLVLRVASPSEIMQWATSDVSGDAPYGDACHPFGLPVLLWGFGGDPVPGNGAYKLSVFGLPGSSVLLVLGLSNTLSLGVPLPLDLGPYVPALAGCQLRASADLLMSAAIGPTGSVDFALPIPPLAGLVGVDAYCQAVLFSSILGEWSSTNAWAMHIGN